MREATFVFMILILTVVLSFGVTALCIKGLAWAFGFAFSWKLVVGAWIVLFLLQGIFKHNK